MEPDTGDQQTTREAPLERNRIKAIPFGDWDRQRAPQLNLPRGQALVGAIVVGGALGVLTYLAATRTPGKNPALVYGLAALLDVTFLLGVAVAVVKLSRERKYRDAELLFDRFPFLVGDRVAVRLQLPRALREVDRGPLVATFRCVRQRLEQKLNGNHALRSDQVFAETTRRDVPAADPDVALEFTVPADAPPTQFDDWPRYHYELEVSAEAPGLDFHTIFLLPVYREPDVEA